MKKRIFALLGFFSLFVFIAIPCHAAKTLIAQKADSAPVIDGIENEPVWEKTQAIVTHDQIAGIDITLKAFYYDTQIFFLVSFPDPDQSNEHKSWIWDSETEMYTIGPDREDSFVFKWNMEPLPVDLSVYADNSYTADIWFWKACRTDPSGFADDKTHRLSSLKMVESKKVTSKSGKVMYLERKGDDGTPAYQDILYSEFDGEKRSRFDTLVPTGSRADVKAKGVWSEGRWTIEFSRAFKTGHQDDVQFILGKKFLFGVSRYEIAGRDPDPESTQPLYGAGDVFEILELVISLL